MAFVALLGSSCASTAQVQTPEEETKAVEDQTIEEPAVEASDFSPAASAFLEEFRAEIKARRTPKHPRLGEDMSAESVDKRLQEMVDLDQYARNSFNGAVSLGLEPAEEERVFSEIGMATMSIDEDHTKELQTFVRANGWITQSAYGDVASHNAWILAQHADMNREFQRYVLELMDPLVDAGEVKSRNYAYLWDRVAVGTQTPQRFGTQGQCVGPGKWEPAEMEDPAGVDKRRAEVGLEPMEEYKAKFKEMCGV